MDSEEVDGIRHQHPGILVDLPVAVDAGHYLLLGVVLVDIDGVKIFFAFPWFVHENMLIVILLGL